MADSIHTDNTHIRNRIGNRDSRKSCIGNPDTQTQPRLRQFPLKLARQNPARERKRIQLPPMQLREGFSWFSLSVCLFVLRGTKALLKDFPDAIEYAPPSIIESDAGRLAVPIKMAKTGALLANPAT